ncbi:MAG TPA: folylpolyglutamate synthase/dihydrofolate synthase family protein [Sphingomicrobium sp.]|nr:folylpolyglutamate synthase/dihydrofolate synthase family protein [Sphingomicrobium sp.]
MDFARSASPLVQAQLDRLPALAPPGDRLGLERIAALLDRLGRPQDQLPPVFHVAGTNGKGSTVAFLRATLEASGLRVHVFTSPHLVRFNERIRIAGELIDDASLAALLAEVLDKSHGIEPSFFEVVTAASFLAFARTPADASLLEVGLGGRLDATNVIEHPLVTGIASVALDHQHYLGPDVASIAREKAGIAKPGVPLVSVAQEPEAATAIADVARERGAPLLLEGRDWSIDSDLQPGLAGVHQRRNAGLAWAMLSARDVLSVPRSTFLHAIGEVRWPARFERLHDGPLTNGKATWIDGAHNAAAAEALAGILAERGPMHIVLGILANKDAEAIVAALRPHALSLTFVPVPDHEHHDPEDLKRKFGGRMASSVTQALADLPEPRLVAGSLYLAGAVLAANGEVPD